MQVYKLKPHYNNCKSFYGKAFVEIGENGELFLYSYNTLVAKIKGKKAILLGKFSKTTTKHQKEFLKQNNFDVKNINQYL